MADRETGLSEELCNALQDTIENNNNLVMAACTKGFQGVLDKMGENWGTKDGVTWVGSSAIPAMEDMGKQIAKLLKQIGEVTRQTALVQSRDTGNMIQAKSVGLPCLGGLENKNQEVLSNGYVGIFEQLKGDVSSAANTAKSNVSTAIDTLKKEAKAKAGEAFHKTGQADAVATELEAYCEKVKKTVNEGLDSLNKQMNEQVANADSYVKSIQDAGLRSTAS